MKRLTPKKAMDKHCSLCKNGYTFDCMDADCPLNWDLYKTKVKTYLGRIRKFCLYCVGDSFKLVSECDGETLNMGFCPLHEYRFGKNPALKGKGKRITPASETV